ncbi:MAG: protein kinase, partial [Planctomycetia bacterium]|nr:protein kinase [Planctomycetia bacterium]
VVFRAVDRNLNAEVVVKAPRQGLLDDPKFAGRFAREIRSLVQLPHPHIVKVLDVGEHEGVPFAVMQYLSGGTLRGRLNADGTLTQSLPPAQLLAWLPDVAEALDYIHARGYIHRDVKPENILFDGAGHVYLSDFGIAKVVADAQTNLTGTGAVVGTPHYMSPEQLHEKPLDGRVDQYALGVLVYEILAGRRPFEGPSALVIALHMTQAAPPLHQTAPGVSPRLSAVVGQALEKDPVQRFPNCRAFAQALVAEVRGDTPAEAILTVQPAPATEPLTSSVRCPGCGEHVAARLRAGEQRVHCPRCGEVFQPPRLFRPQPVLHDTRTNEPTLPASQTAAPRPSRAAGCLAVLSLLFAAPAALLPLAVFLPTYLVGDAYMTLASVSVFLGLALGCPSVALAVAGLFFVRRSARRGSALLLLLLALCAGLGAMLFGVGAYVAVGVPVAREAAHDMTAKNNLRQLGTALHTYELAHAALPPAERNGLSWRVHLLPFLDYEPLYRQFKLDEPWDSPHNLPLAWRLPAVYRDPFTTGDPDGKTYYRVLVGPGTAWKRETGTKLSEFWDGLSNTILVVEAAEPVIWSKPDELTYDPQGLLPAFRVSKRGEFRALFADGSVQRLPAWNNDQTLRAYITANGKEFVPFPGR